MRVQAWLAIVVLSTALAPTAASEDPDQLVLSPAWPASFQQARSEPIPLIPGPPIGAPDASHGPWTPGSNTVGNEHRFELALLNPNGTPGPFGDLSLDPSRDVAFVIYLAADQTPEPLGVSGPHQDDHGIAPRVSVQARLTIANETVARGEKTKTLVSGPASDPVEPYRFTFEHERKTLPAGSGFTVDVLVHQVDAKGQRTSQPFWNVHTGESYPTHVTVPLESEERQPATVHQLPRPAERETRTGAFVVLVASLCVAAGAAVRAWHQRG